MFVVSNCIAPCLLSQILVYFAAFVVYTASNLEKKEGVFRGDIFGYFLILLFVGTFIVAAWTVLLELWGYSIVVEYVDSRRAKLASSSTSVLGKSVAFVNIRVSAFFHFIKPQPATPKKSKFGHLEAETKYGESEIGEEDEEAATASNVGDESES